MPSKWELNIYMWEVKARENGDVLDMQGVKDDSLTCQAAGIMVLFTEI